MSHEIEQRDGRASVFSYIQTAWHRLGTVLTKRPTLDEAMVEARLDYTVTKCPTVYVTPTGELRDSRSAFVTVRTDTNEELGAVGPGYEPVQNIDAFRMFEPLLDEGLLELETGGVLRQGADAWILGRWNIEKFSPIVREIYADQIVPFTLIATNHNGRRGVLMRETPVRVVCANTLDMAERSSGQTFVIRHTAEAKTRMIDAAHALFAGVLERHAVAADAFQTLRATFLTQDQFSGLLDVIAPSPLDRPGFNPEAKTASAVLERNVAKRSTLTRLWTEGKGHVGDNSAWEAYNAVVEAVDHDAEGLWPIRGGAWKRGSSLLDGTLKRLKDDAFAYCMRQAA